MKNFVHEVHYCATAGFSDPTVQKLKWIIINSVNRFS